jgi:hypothetical protein
MKSIYRTLTFPVLGLFCLVGAVQLSESLAKARAVAFMRLVAPGISKEETASARTEYWFPPSANSTQGSRWETETGNRFVAIDEASGVIVRYTNRRLSNRATGPRALQGTALNLPFYGSKEDLVARAQAKLTALRIPFGPVVAGGPVPASPVVYLRFYEKPYGYSAEGSGNMTLIGLDSSSGQIIELQRFIGFHAEPAKLNINKARAIEIARKITPLSPSASIYGPMYREISFRDHPSARGMSLCRNKTLTLAYCVVGAREVVIVAADTGEILSHRSAARG